MKISTLKRVVKVPDKWVRIDLVQEWKTPASKP
jgi:hypothetical protein